MNNRNLKFVECQVCKFLTELEYPEISKETIVIGAEGDDDLIFCEECGSVLLPKDYAPKLPKFFSEKPKKATKKVKKSKKKSLTTKKKKRIISPSNKKNEDI